MKLERSNWEQVLTPETGHNLRPESWRGGAFNFSRCSRASSRVRLNPNFIWPHHKLPGLLPINSAYVLLYFYIIRLIVWDIENVNLTSTKFLITTSNFTSLYPTLWSQFKDMMWWRTNTSSILQFRFTTQPVIGPCSRLYPVKARHLHLTSVPSSCCHI